MWHKFDIIMVKLNFKEFSLDYKIYMMILPIILHNLKKINI